MEIKKTSITILMAHYAMLIFSQGTSFNSPFLGNYVKTVFNPEASGSRAIGGDAPVITRLEGVGAGQNFLELADGEYEKILGGITQGEVTYRSGAAPISVQIINPELVKAGEYIITFFDPLPGDTLSLETRWTLMNTNGDTIAIADQPISQFNEQYVTELGISIRIEQSDDAGDKVDATNGTIGYSVEYADPSKPQWLTFLSDDLGGSPLFNFIQTELPAYPNYLFDPDQAFSAFAPVVPYFLADYAPEEPSENPFGWNITPAWLDPSGSAVQVPQFDCRLQTLNNVDIILTSDTSKWSRCVVIETANQYYTSATGLGLESEGNKKSFTTRSRLSVGKRDTDLDGFPDPDGATDIIGNPLTGMGWFPGYAVDVETGDRLNIFFGENSVYRGLVADALGLGTISHDMLWNPTTQIVLEGGFLSPLELFVGGQHYIYVTREKYDGCEEIRSSIDRTNVLIKARELAKITWTAIPVIVDDPEINMLPLNDGLIPNNVTIKIRVDNPYQLATGTGQFNDYPTYRFKLEGITSSKEVESAASTILLYPNPASKQVNIETERGWSGETTIQIYYSNGTLALGGKFRNQQKITMDVSTLVPGMYFVDIRTDTGLATRKLIIQ